MVLQILDILRMVIVIVAFFFGYLIGFANDYDPVLQLHFMVPVVIVAIAGISGLEGLFFSKKAAEIKGYETGSNYQRQSAIHYLAADCRNVISCDESVGDDLVNIQQYANLHIHPSRYQRQWS